MNAQLEALGPAERVIKALLDYQDHMVHNRPGYVVPDPTSVVGVRWSPVTHKVEKVNDKDVKVVYALTKVGKKSVRTKVGVLQDNGDIKNDAGHVIGQYRPAGLFPEVATWMYSQVSEVWKLDNEFSARWASYAFAQDHKDLKTVLAAFMLVQSRKGEPVLEGDKVIFHDDDYRDVGESMMLLLRKDDRHLNPKLLLRIYDVLTLPSIAKMNHDLGFGKSARRPFTGRWEKAVEKWLRYREENPKMLEGLMKAGFGSTIKELSRRIGYKPTSPRFFDLLRWKQAQSKDGRRSISIGKAVAAAESWEGLTEMQICQKISQEKPSYKRIVGLLPKGVGLTRAIMAAAIEAGSLSDKDLVIASPTLEELGLFQVQDIRERWERAVKASEDMRAANIATRMKSKESAEKLQEGADAAVKKAVEEVVRGLRIYVTVDISGSMHNCIPTAKTYLAKFLQGFPLEQLHVSVFNTAGSIVQIKHASAAGVEQAFRGKTAGGGTCYAEGVRVFQNHKPKDGEDALFIFVGDEQENGTFEHIFQTIGIKPMAFGFIRVTGSDGTFRRAVQDTAVRLQVPCFMIDEKTFNDVYAIPRTIRNLVASTPVGVAARNVVQPIRVSLVETILKTDLLVKPAWAA